MKVNIKKLSSNQIELEVEISAVKMENYFQLAASELSKNMRVNGFRPGKVPIEIVEREKSSQKLYDQASNLAIQKTLTKAILDLPTGKAGLPTDKAGNQIKIVGQPNIVVLQIAQGNPMKYKATFSIIPEVKLENYKGLKIKRKKLKVEDKEIDKSLDYIQKSRAKLITVNRPAEKGDRVEIDFITRSSGVKIEGGESKNQPILLGESRFVPGFEEKLIGMKSGEEKEFSLIVPQDWPRKNLANKNLDFQVNPAPEPRRRTSSLRGRQVRCRVKMNLVQKRDIPKLSDEFAKNLGKFQSLTHLKENIKKGLLQEKKIKDKERIRGELIEKVAESLEINIPQALIDIELNKMVEELRQGLSENMGLDFNKYLSQIKKTIEDLKREWQDQAKKRVKIGLALEAIAKKEKIEVTQEEVESRINEDLKRYPNTEEIKKNIDSNLLKEYTKNILRNEKVFELLEKNARIE